MPAYLSRSNQPDSENQHSNRKSESVASNFHGAAYLVNAGPAYIESKFPQALQTSTPAPFTMASGAKHRASAQPCICGAGCRPLAPS